MMIRHRLAPSGAMLFTILLAAAVAGAASATAPTQPATRGPAPVAATVPTSAATSAPTTAQAARILGGLKAPAGFDMTLFAAPPHVNYPTCVTATPRGDVFVGIDEQGSLGREADGGRIVHCVDTDGDGSADRVTQFARVEHPRGLAWDDAAGALYVLHPPTLTRYFDDDRDGVADRSETLVKAIGNHKATAGQGADHTTNGIRLGIDGWIYVAVGDFGIIDAVGSDGRRLKLHGGGIVRVRTDGSGLETFASGMRNIYDVAIDPMMNVFTRDNTNDGDGWNDRLTHSVAGAYHGYPSRYKRFANEIADCMLDLGTGSPTGSLFVDEPALPQRYRNVLFTVEWGRNRIDRHALVASGASFTADVEELMDLPRAIDIDADGRGRLYLASWAGGAFKYTNPNVGYILRLAPQGVTTPPPFPDLARAGDEELLAHLASPSGVCRQAAQREILRRGDKPPFAQGLGALAKSEAALSARVAAVFTLRLLRGAASDAGLIELSKTDALREFALRALADRKDDAKFAAEPFVAALRDANPRVRLVAVRALGRHGQRDAAKAMLPLTADPDPLVAHVAINSLIELKAVDVCLAAVAAGEFTAGALRVLQEIHEPAVVTGLIQQFEQAKPPTLRVPILRALCRLHFREREWDGTWWGTRPDSRGPYFQPVAWSETPRIAELLRNAIASEEQVVLRALLIEVAANRIEIPEVTARLLEIDLSDAGLSGALLDSVAGKETLSEREIAAVVRVGRAEQINAAIRARAIRLLAHEDAGDAANEAALELLGAVAEMKWPPEELTKALEAFLFSPDQAKRIPTLVRLAGGGSAPRREVAFATLICVVENRLTRGERREQAEAAMDAAWKEPSATVPLLRAVARTRSPRYAEQVRARLRDADKEVAHAAATAADRLGISATAGSASSQPSVTVASLSYDAARDTVLKAQGDVKRGKELFAQQGCTACHTVSAEEVPKGPFLGGIATRYSRAELFESVAKPSAKIAQGFDTQWFKTKNDVLEGFVTRESGEEIELRNVSGSTTVLKKPDVKGRGKREKSVMPEGLIGNLSPADAASLIAYLESLKAK